MAQYWVVCDSLDKVVVSKTSGFTETVETVGGVPVIQTTSSGNTRALMLSPVGMIPSEQLDVAVLCDINRTDGVVETCGAAVRAEEGALDRVAYGIQNRARLTADSRLFIGDSSIVTTVLSPALTDVTTLHWRACRIGLDSANAPFEMWAWDGGVSDANLRPATPDYSADATGFSGFDPYAIGVGYAGAYHRGRLTGGATVVNVAIIAVGTDGDPAPTGPVGGARRRSPLIWTPW